MSAGFSPGTELRESFTQRDVEQAFRWANEGGDNWQANPKVRSAAEQGIRLARARDPRMLAALERTAEVMDKLAESQVGRTIRDPGLEFAMKKTPTQTQIAREAYLTADRGDPAPTFGLVYAAVAKMAHLIT